MAALVLPSSQIVSRKRVGTHRGRDVYHIVGSGGINVIAAVGGGATEVLGLGSHPLIARIVAKRADPSVQFDDLEKAAHAAGVATPEAVAAWAAETAHYRRSRG